MRARLLITAALSLFVGLGLYAVPAAQADDPIPLRFMEFGAQPNGPYEGDLIRLSVRVNSYPSDAPAEGTVTFSSDQGYGPVTVPLHENGQWNADTDLIQIPPTGVTTYTATYHSTNGYADQTMVKTVTPGHRLRIMVTPEPTVARLKGGLVPQLTLTPAATAKLENGTPVAGMKVTFTYPCLEAGPWIDCSGLRTICVATTNASGYATCGANGTLASVLSLLGVKVFVRPSPPDNEHYGVFFANNDDRSPVILLQ